MESNWKKIIGGVKCPPTMVFSVIEDSESNVYRPWPRSVFKKALIEAAKSGGGMIQYICIHSFLLTFLGNVALFYLMYWDINLSFCQFPQKHTLYFVKLRIFVLLIILGPSSLCVL